MAPNRRRDLTLDVWGVLLLVPLLVVPFATKNPLFESLTYQVAVGVSAAYIIAGVFTRHAIFRFSDRPR